MERRYHQAPAVAGYPWWAPLSPVQLGHHALWRLISLIDESIWCWNFYTIRILVLWQWCKICNKLHRVQPLRDITAVKHITVEVESLTVSYVKQTWLASNWHLVLMRLLSTFHLQFKPWSHMSTFKLFSFTYKIQAITYYNLQRNFRESGNLEHLIVKDVYENAVLKYTSTIWTKFDMLTEKSL